ncbi:unnamed protein product [Brachionus calyciflorus]|uniref:G-protein coupled receptors family 1 profile domain-containing protein n=1 Tax=Brachionus calyciflorus TaxID=104777 RepID=A0A814IDR2_9BILA|nr:unnamed protein product [Brachionus calyciflorus]
MIFLASFNLPLHFQLFPMYQSSLTCVVYSFILRVLYQANSWLNVAITTDRLLFILYPNRYKIQKNKKFISLILIGLSFLILILNTPNFFYYLSIIETKPSSTTNQSLIIEKCTADPDIILIRSLITILFRIVLPFLLMLFMNVILVYKVFKSKNKFRNDKILINDIKFSLTVVASTIVFLVCLLPSGIYVFMHFVSQYDNVIRNEQTTRAFFLLFEVTSSYLYLLSYSFSFFIHLCINSLFRKETKKFLNSLMKIFSKNLVLTELSSNFKSNSKKFLPNKL